MDPEKILRRNQESIRQMREKKGPIYRKWLSNILKGLNNKKTRK